ncbi:hypothetical protein ACLM44_05235 [Synechococcus sp. W2B2]|mgnify:FL=1|uniref:hypothetical protein n=1 Tax=unclassified Synechococcus TaxID=2626047 RepID=UPI00006BD668|nr:hypothetical protein [Synechococcus sp. WH 7805]EAR18227.1 hypothetical protein WH7805_05526 [Synechococcus sp. WH 7805]
MTNRNPNFQEAMEIAATWLKQWDEEEISDEVMADRAAELLASRDGARGFFVVSLAGESTLMDRLPDALVIKLREAGDGVVDLTARNLAMSAAMVVHHRNNGDEAQAMGSERVNQRCTELLRQLDSQRVKERLETLLEAASHSRGDDLSFLERWGYNKDQKEAIGEAVHAVAETGRP